MNIKLALSVLATVALLASGLADAQRGGGGGGGGNGGGGRGGMSGGGNWGGGSGGGSWSGNKNWSGGSGGSWNGNRNWNGNGSWNGNRNWNGNGSWNGHRGWGWNGNHGWGWNAGWGCRGWCGAWGWNAGWGGAWWGGPWWPGVTFAVGAPAVWASTWPVATGFAPATFSSIDSDQVFMEQDPQFQPAPARQPAQQAYWYYCTEPAGYYPYVQACSKAWVPVVPQSVAPARNAPSSF